MTQRIPLIPLALLAALSFLPMSAITAQDAPVPPQETPAAAQIPPTLSVPVVVANRFESLATDALKAMERKAAEIKPAGGAAIVGFIPGQKMTGWISRVKVVETFTPKNSNVLAVAYCKAAEMADTLVNSGSKIRPKRNGENGFKGGVIAKVTDGYVFAAFSGAKAEEDVAIAQAGLEVLTQK